MRTRFNFFLQYKSYHNEFMTGLCFFWRAVLCWALLGVVATPFPFCYATKQVPPIGYLSYPIYAANNEYQQTPTYYNPYYGSSLSFAGPRSVAVYPQQSKSAPRKRVPTTHHHPAPVQGAKYPLSLNMFNQHNRPSPPSQPMPKVLAAPPVPVQPNPALLVPPASPPIELPAQAVFSVNCVKLERVSCAATPSCKLSWFIFFRKLWVLLPTSNC